MYQVTSYEFKSAWINWSMTKARCVLIVVLCDVFAACLWNLGGCSLTGTRRRTPWGVVKVISSPLDLFNSTAIVLKFIIYSLLQFAEPINTKSKTTPTIWFKKESKLFLYFYILSRNSFSCVSVKKYFKIY